MPEYRVTFKDCIIEVRNVIAEDEDKAYQSAEDTVLIEAAKTSFDVITGFEVDVEEE